MEGRGKISQEDIKMGGLAAETKVRRERGIAKKNKGEEK